MFRRVPGNVLLITAIFTIFMFYRPIQKFPHFDTSVLSLYLNRSDPASPNEPYRISASACSNTTQVFTTTQSCFCLIQTTPPALPIPPIEVLSIDDVSRKFALQKPTAEQETVARLRDEGIVIIFKTGAQEVAHLAIQIGTTLRYLSEQDILFFSDVQGSIGPFIINDALRNVDQSLRTNDPDFEIYRNIKSYDSTGQDIEELKEDNAKGNDRSGWRLDKYKFMHMVEETFEMRPNAKWYVFIETDSYVVWNGLVGMLKRMDSTKPWYLGSAVMLGDTAFGHGGSGYVLSNAALNKLLGPEQPQGLAASWDERVKDMCCGDQALGTALKEKGVLVKGAHPFLNGDKPTTLTYGPHDHWCQPAVTMHHMLPKEISSLWRFERQRELLLENPNATIFSDLFYHFVEPHLRESRDNWNNLSDGPTFDKKRVEKDEEWEEKDREQRKKKADKLAKMKEEAAQKEAQSKEKARPGSSEGDENKSKEEAESKEGEKPEAEDDTDRKKGNGDKSNEEAKFKGGETSEEEDKLEGKKSNEDKSNEESKLKGGEKSEEEYEKEEKKGNEHTSNEEAKFKGGETSEGKEKSDKSEKSGEDIKEGQRESDQSSDSKDSKQIKAVKIAPQKEESSDSKSSDDKRKDKTTHDDVEKKEFLAQGDHKEEETKKGTREKRAEILPLFDAAAQRRIKSEVGDEVETNSGRPEKRDGIEDLQRPKPLTETEKKAYLSFEDCGAACREDKDCFQYVYYEQTCKLEHAFRLGKYKAPDSQGEVVWKSGWMLKKIRQWVEMNPCEGPEWPNWR